MPTSMLTVSHCQAGECSADESDDGGSDDGDVSDSIADTSSPAQGVFEDA